jgi:hypothetical protein
VVKSSNLTKLWPSLLEITNETLLPDGGYYAEWKYKMSWISLSGIGECIENKPNLLLVSINIGDFESTVTFALQSFNARTRVYFLITNYRGCCQII